MKTTILLAAVLGAGLQGTVAAPLTQSTVTEIVQEVNLLSPAGVASPASLNDVVKAPERVRTGAASRAELTAPDQTITRVGANTVFSFENQGRVLNLEKGSLLFHSPKGAGGGTIKSGGASAAVLGTTLIVAATEDGGFKVILLEGRGRVTLPNGKSVNLRAGQMVYVLPGGVELSQVLDVNLGRLVAGSLLVNGFARELPSLALIRAAVNSQNEMLAKGRAEDTGVTADAFALRPRIGDGLSVLDDNAYTTFVLPIFGSERGQLTGAEQVILMEVERQRTKEPVTGGPMPPLPPTPLTPTRPGN